MNNADLSRKSPRSRSAWIDMGRILATIMIVYYHLPSSLFRGHGPIGNAIDWLFANPLASLSFFFIFAGYFVGPGITVSRAASKTLTLLLPYLFWNLLCIPGLSDEASWQRVFGWGYAGPPADYPLWFVRDLIILTLLAPCLQRALYGGIPICVVFVLWGNHWHSEWLHTFPFPTPGATLLYLTGLGLSRIPIEKLHARFKQGIPALLILLAAFYAARQLGYLPSHADWSLLIYPFLLTGALLLAADVILWLSPPPPARQPISPSGHLPVFLSTPLTLQLSYWRGN